MNNSGKIIFDLSDLMNAFDGLLTATNPEAAKESTESDMVRKYKQLYESSVKIEELRNIRVEIVRYIDAYKTKLKSIDSQIDELNKLFSN